MRRETIRALEVRKNSVMAERRKSQMQTLGANNEYGIVTNVNYKSIKMNKEPIFKIFLLIFFFSANK